MAYVYNLQTTSSGFTPYYSGAYYYAEEAFKNGGAWYDASNPSGIEDGFVVAMSTGSGYIKTYLDANDLNHITLSPLYPTGDGTYIINPAVGSGDVRGTGVGYSGTVGVGAGLQPLSGNTTYYHGLYARMERVAGSVAGGSGLVGIGTTAGDWPNYGYYSGVFTTDRVRHQFKAEYNTGTQSGSGVYVGSDVSLRIGIVDRAGNQINNLETSPFISGGLNIDLTTVPQSPVTTVVENWQTDYQTTTVNVASADLRNAFGDDTKDFGIRWRGTSDIGEGITGIYFLYNNDPPEIKSITWKDGNGKFTDESPSNFKSPNPSAQNATVLTSHQTVNTTEKSKGIVEATVTFDGQDWADIQYLELYGYQSTDENTTIPLNAENLLKRFEVQQTKIQTFEIPKSAGVKSDVPFYYLWVPRNHAGKAGKTFKSGPYTLPSIALGRDPIVYNAGSEVTNQKVNGCFTVFDCLKVEAKDVATPYLLVNGDAKGSSSSHGDRLTLGGVPYLLSGDSPSSSNTYVTSAAFGTSNGVLTLTRNDAGTVTVDLDGRYQDALTFGISAGNVTKVGGGGLSDDDFVRVNGTTYEGRSASDVRGDLSLGSLALLSAVDADSVTVSNLEVDNFKASAIVLESEGISSHDNDTSLPTSAAVKDYVDNTVIPDTNTYVTSAAFGTSNGVLTLTRNDAATVTVDLDGRYQDEITSSNRLNANLISAGSVSNTEFDYLDGVTSAIQTQLDGKQATLTFGIASDNVLQSNGTMADNEFLKVDGTKIEGRSTSEVKTDLSLNNVENTALSTWAGSSNITTVGSITAGEWAGTAIADAYISSASTWNAKQDAITASNRLNANLISAGSVSNTEFDYIDGVTSNIQTQLDAKQATINSSNRLNANLISAGSVSNTEFDYLDGVTSAIQTQLNAKQDSLTFGIATDNVLQSNGTMADDEFLKVDGTKIEGRSASEVKTDLSLNNVENTALSTFAGSTNITTLGSITAGQWAGTAIEDAYIASAGSWNAKQDAITSSNRLNANLVSNGSVSNTEFDYLDGVTSNIQTQLDAKQASLSFGISTDNVLQSNGTMADNEFLKVDGTKIEGRSTSEVKTDLSLNNVENTALSTWAGSSNITTVGSISAGEWGGTAIADGYISSASTWNAKQDALSFGISSDNVLRSNGTMADNEFLKVDGTKIEGRDAGQVKTDLSLNNVENTALSTWGGSSNITTVGSISAGEWAGTAIGDSYIASAGSWNGKQDAITSSNRLNANLVSAGSVSNTEFDYLDGVTSAIQTQLNGKQASLSFGISTDNVLQSNGTMSDNQFLKVDGTKIEGRSASDVRSDIDAQETIDTSNRLSATLVGANGNISNTEYGYLNGVSSNIQTQLNGKQASLSFGISSDNVLQSNGTMSDNEFLKVDGTKIEGRSASEVKTDLSLTTTSSVQFGSLGIGNSATNKLDVGGGMAIGASYVSSSAPSNGLLVQGNVGIGTNYPSYALHVNGSIVGSYKSFLIDHPSKEGKKLMHGCIEGPELAVYFRGKSDLNLIKTPDYWEGLVDIDSMTVELTAIGPNQNLYVSSIAENGDITIGSNTDEPLNYFYAVYGERKDVKKLDVEIDIEEEEPVTVDGTQPEAIADEEEVSEEEDSPQE